VLRHEDRMCPNERGDLELGRRHDDGAIQVAKGLADVLLLVAGDDHERKFLAPRAEQIGRLTCRRLREPGAVEDAEGAVGRVLREGRAERRTARLAVHLYAEVARGRREGDAAAGPVRRTRRASAGATRALLPPRLRAAAGD